MNYGQFHNSILFNLKKDVHLIASDIRHAECVAIWFVYEQKPRR